MSVDEFDAAQDAYLTRLYEELGPEWVAEHSEELYKEHYDQAVREFTAERLKSYYLTHPSVGERASSSLV